MNQYRGQVRRPSDITPSRSSLQNQRNNFQQVQQEKYSRNKDFQKSQLSYYQSQMSHTVYDNQMIQSTRMSDKQRSINENKELYDNLIPIRVQSTERQEYSTYLRVQIINTVQKGMNKLTLYLTDDRDPKFLWLFFIKQSDFMMLKKEQKLRVDFRGFPSMLMDHFDMCKSEKQATNSINMGECYFFSLFEMKKNEGSLNILQANKYKQSVHLSLKCKLGNDEQIKQYLSEKLLKCENENNNLRATISNLQQTLGVRKQQISRMQVQLKQQKKTNEKSEQQFQLQMTRIQTEMKRDRIQTEQKLKRSYQKQYKDMKLSLEQQLNKYMKSYDELKIKYESAQQKIAMLQSKQRQSTFDINTKNKQIQTYTKRLQEIKTYTVELQNTKTQNQKTIIQQRVKIQSLQSQIADKLKIIQTNVQLKSNNSHQISSLQTKNQESKKQIQKLQTKIQNLQNQLQKVQSMLEQYKQKYEKRKQKNQQKNNIIKQQQRYINEKENQILELKRMAQNKQKTIDQLKLDLQDRNRKINQLKRQIEECQNKIKQDNDLIIHLQKQLNQRTIGIRPTFSNNFQRSTSPFTSNVSRYDTTAGGNINLANTTASRLKFTSTGNVAESNNIQEQSERLSRKEIEIKRYTPTNQQAFIQRSKSPITNSRLNQQKDPQQNKSNQTIVKPVKFKFSQRE